MIAKLPVEALLEFEDEGYALESLRRRAEHLDMGSVRKFEDFIVKITRLLGG